jgi:hypothetical protein
MENLSKKDLIDVINRSSEELHQKIDRQRFIMSAILEEGVRERTLKRFVPQSSSHERMLKEALKETIDVLEQTRKAFKSKRLEVLRKKLTQVLIDTE